MPRNDLPSSGAAAAGPEPLGDEKTKRLLDEVNRIFELSADACLVLGGTRLGSTPIEVEELLKLAVDGYHDALREAYPAARLRGPFAPGVQTTDILEDHDILANEHVHANDAPAIGKLIDNVTGMAMYVRWLRNARAHWDSGQTEPVDEVALASQAFGTLLPEGVNFLITHPITERAKATLDDKIQVTADPVRTTIDFDALVPDRDQRQHYHFVQGKAVLPE